MTGYVQCPSCKTIFKVAAQQLDVHHGLVRCGQCQDIFNGTWNLVDELPAGAAQDVSGEASSAPTNESGFPLPLSDYEPAAKQPHEIAARSDDHDVAPENEETAGRSDTEEAAVTLPPIELSDWRDEDDRGAEPVEPQVDVVGRGNGEDGDQEPQVTLPTPILREIESAAEQVSSLDEIEERSPQAQAFAEDVAAESPATVAEANLDRDDASPLGDAPDGEPASLTPSTPTSADSGVEHNEVDPVDVLGETSGLGATADAADQTADVALPGSVEASANETAPPEDAPAVDAESDRAAGEIDADSGEHEEVAPSTDATAEAHDERSGSAPTGSAPGELAASTAGLAATAGDATVADQPTDTVELDAPPDSVEESPSDAQPDEAVATTALVASAADSSADSPEHDVTIAPAIERRGGEDESNRSRERSTDAATPEEKADLAIKTDTDSPGTEPADDRLAGDPPLEEIVIEAPPNLWNAFNDGGRVDRESAAPESDPASPGSMTATGHPRDSEADRREAGLRSLLDPVAGTDHSAAAGGDGKTADDGVAHKSAAGEDSSGEITREMVRPKIGQDVKLVEIPRPRPLQTIAWLLAALGLLGVLVWQLKQYYLNDLAQMSALRPYLTTACAFLDCNVPPRSAFKLIDLVGTSVNAHPHTPGALRVSVNLVNRAQFEQLYPPLEITLTDSGGRVVGRRTYVPSEYLADRSKLLLPSVIQQVDLDLARPSETAIGYEIQLVKR